MQEPSPSAGSVRLLDHELTGLKIKPLRKARSRMQMIMQDPVSSLNPRRRVRDLVAEGLAIWGYDGDDMDASIREKLTAVGLDQRSEERRVGKESVRQCSSGWSAYR